LLTRPHAVVRWNAYHTVPLATTLASADAVLDELVRTLDAGGS